jgi:hypothetical protein
MATLEQRITRIESATAESPAFEQFIRCLPPLGEHGELNWSNTRPQFAEIFGPFFTERGNKSQRCSERLSDPVERGLADFLVTFNDSDDPFVYERYPGRVPDRVLAAIYNGMRNHAFMPDVALRVRQLAGCLDAKGQLLPGYGCITDA